MTDVEQVTETTSRVFWKASDGYPCFSKEAAEKRNAALLKVEWMKTLPARDVEDQTWFYFRSYDEAIQYRNARYAASEINQRNWYTERSVSTVIPEDPLYYPGWFRSDYESNDQSKDVDEYVPLSKVLKEHDQSIHALITLLCEKPPYP